MVQIFIIIILENSKSKLSLTNIGNDNELTDIFTFSEPKLFSI